MKLFWCLVGFAFSLGAQSGRLTIHMILHSIGEERYEFVPSGDGLTLTTNLEYSDRGNQRTTNAVLRMKSDYTPLSLEVKPRPSRIQIQDASATITEDEATRTVALPERYFTILGQSPFALQIAMVRYWQGHGKPANLPVLRANAAAPPSV